LQVRKHKPQKSAFSSVVRTKEEIMRLSPQFERITTYTISLLANRLGDSIDLDKIWQQQDISSQLKQQVQAWAVDVDRILHQSAAGRMVSEWAKKPECWDAVRDGKYSSPLSGIPEVKASAVSSVA
jgi:hypothetical protein